MPYEHVPGNKAGSLGDRRIGDADDGHRRAVAGEPPAVRAGNAGAGEAQGTGQGAAKAAVANDRYRFVHCSVQFLWGYRSRLLQNFPNHFFAAGRTPKLPAVGRKVAGAVVGLMRRLASCR